MQEQLFSTWPQADEHRDGVLLIEAMAQTAGALVVDSLGDQMHGKLVYFMSIEDARFRLPEAKVATTRPLPSTSLL